MRAGGEAPGLLLSHLGDHFCVALQLVGMEMCEPAVLDARVNAALNGVENALFVVGTAESTFAQIAKEALPGGVTEVIAVVDPPRSGLHNNVIKVLRVCRHIKRFVYVSCNPTGSFVEDAVKYDTASRACTNCLLICALMS